MWCKTPSDRLIVLRSRVDVIDVCLATKSIVFLDAANAG